MFFDSIKKSFKLKKISKILGAPLTLDVQSLIKDSSKNDEALDNLYNLSKDFKYTNKRLDEYKVDKERFKRIYGNLVIAGAGQWIKGHWVPASSLVFGSTLEYILEELEKHKGEDLNSSIPLSNIPGYWMEIAFNLIEYFEKGKMGRVE